MQRFEPLFGLRNPHAQTFAYALWPRNFPRLPAGVRREFETEPGTRILGHCHWQPFPRECPTLAVVHGLEGSSESGYMLGLAERAFAAGWNAIRLNQRNCGGTEALTPTLYNSGLSGDYAAVLAELIGADKLPAIFFAGYSMGGNLVLKLAGDLADNPPPQLLGVAAVGPSLDLAACADAVARPGNFWYQRRFLIGLKARMRRKAKLFPGRYDLARMSRVRTLREFDDVITAPYCGYRDAADYYAQASALRVAGRIRVPTSILTAQDDPFVPFESFSDTALAGNAFVTIVAPERGGHCAFISRQGGESRFWGELQVMTFAARLAAAAGNGRSVAEPRQH